MLDFAKIYFLIFGLVTVASGASGYVTKHSLPSLIAGGALGIVMLVGALLVPGNWRLGLGLALFSALCLAGRFIPAVVKGLYNPGAYLVPLSLIGIVLAVLAFVNAGK